VIDDEVVPPSKTSPPKLKTLGKGWIRLSLILSGIFYLPFLGIHAWCITGLGVWSLFGVQELYGIAFLVLVIAFMVLLFLSVFKSTRSESWRSAKIALTLIISFIPVTLAANQLRMLGFKMAAKRAEPLVVAVVRYETRHGSPPKSLAVLVPDYLPGVPGRLPPIEIITGDTAKTRYGGNTWVLTAMVPTGIINWDQFLYYPNGDYPRTGHGGWLERVGAWAYVHE
jgi:hypothetical protein